MMQKMESPNSYDELRMKYKEEDRAKLLMQQLRTIQRSKRERKWWQLSFSRKKTVTPKSWT
jgi:hypothetical protein